MASVLPLLFLLHMLFPFSVLAQTNSQITRGTSLSTDDDNPFRVSPSGDFAFGFRLVEARDIILLAIWFHKVPAKTIVWTAKTGNAVQRGSKIELTTDGRFVLNNPQGQQLWTPQIAGNRQAEHAAMLDTGNFVLRSNRSTIIWGSFDKPTDTILPSQVLGLGSSLMSRLREEDYSVGRFGLRLPDNGNLELYTKAVPTEDDYVSYWESNTIGNGSRLVFNQSGLIYLQLTNQTLFNLSSTSTVSTKDFYHKASLDFDGVFRQYTYPKTVSKDGRWPQSWSIALSLPSDLCMAIRGQVGSGACGYNSYCILDQDQKPTCQCPFGYTYMDPTDTNKGCKQNFSAQSCENNGSKEGEFEIKDMPNTDWPDNDYEWFKAVDEDWCRKACLEDCLCAVAIIREGSCWKKRFPLGNGRMNPIVGGKALIKVGNSSLQPDLHLPPLGGNKNDREALILPGSIVLGGSLFLNFLFVLVIYLVGFRSKHKKQKQQRQGSHTSQMNLCSFTYKELEEATHGFAEELGSGAFATVYKGVLVSDSGTLVAVKKLNKVAEECDKEFKNEVSAIGRTNQKNLVQLLGFCDEGPCRLLVYEYMSNGSLANYLFGSLRPAWYQRIQIAFGVARGLAYLHGECSTQIIHCDVKPQNILLDDAFVARISDFGLAKLLKTDQTRTRTDIRGTRGYVAPEWFKNMAITAKVDVYSFGIILLETICCRKNVKSDMMDEQKAILSDWVYDCYQEEKLHLLVGDDEEAMKDVKRLERFIMVAIWCIQENPSLRPSMKKVTQMLEGAVEVPVPPDPSSFINSVS